MTKLNMMCIYYCACLLLILVLFSKSLHLHNNEVIQNVNVQDDDKRIIDKQMMNVHAIHSITSDGDLHKVIF